MKTYFLLLLLLSTSLLRADTDGAPCTDCAADPNAGLTALTAATARVSERNGFAHRGYISPDELNSMTAREIAEQMVSLLGERCDAVRGAPTGDTVGSTAEVAMYVPSGVLDSIAANGFQNQHVTRTTNGADARDSRFNAEMTLIGMALPYGPEGRDILPKYSALNVTTAPNLGSGSSPDNYGDVIMVMRPEVERRTTWTTVDSLMTSDFRNSQAANSLNFRDRAGEPFECQYYCEAQVWGPLDLSDVGYAMIREGSEVPEALRRAGIPVYFRADTRDNSIRNARGAVAFEGNPRRRPRPLSEDISMTDAQVAGESNQIVRNILEHRRMPNISTSDLISRINNDSTDEEMRRELVGQLALRPGEEAKNALVAVLTNRNDDMTKSQAMLGLSRYGSDPAVRALFLSQLNPSQPISLKIAMAIIADTAGFREDAALRAAVMALDVSMSRVGYGYYGGSSTHPMVSWRNFLFNGAPLCPAPPAAASN